MTDQSDAPNSTDLPDQLAEQLQELETQQLRETIAFAQTLLNHRHESGSDKPTTDNEDILRVEERPGYTLVVRRESQGPILYHVTTNRDANGGEEFNWRYIGPVVDD